MKRLGVYIEERKLLYKVNSWNHGIHVLAGCFCDIQKWVSPSSEWTVDIHGCCFSAFIVDFDQVSTQLGFACSNSTMEVLEQRLKSVQS